MLQIDSRKSRKICAPQRRNSFEVRELTGGKSSVAFSYCIAGHRKDIKGHRRLAKFETRLRLPTTAPLHPSPGRQERG
jgi:hypothetical protein